MNKKKPKRVRKCRGKQKETKNGLKCQHRNIRIQQSVKDPEIYKIHLKTCKRKLLYPEIIDVKQTNYKQHNIFELGNTGHFLNL